MVVWGELTVDIIPDGVHPTGSSVLGGSQEVLQGNDVPVEPTNLRHVDGVGDVIQDKTVDVVVPRRRNYNAILTVEII